MLIVIADHLPLSDKYLWLLYGAYRCTVAIGISATSASCSLLVLESCVVLLCSIGLEMSEKRSFSSPSSLEATETLHGRNYDDKDVFGHEEEHDVRNSICTLSPQR